MNLTSAKKYAAVGFTALALTLSIGSTARRADGQTPALGPLPATVQLWSLGQNGGVPPGYGFPNTLGSYRNTWAVYKLDQNSNSHLMAAGYNDDGHNDCAVSSNNGWSIQATATTAYPSPQNGSNGNQYVTISAIPTGSVPNGIYYVQFNDFYSTTCPSVVGTPPTGVQYQSVNFVLYNGAYWPLNEGNGLNFPINDTSGNGNNATMYPAASENTNWVTSRGEYATVFGGSNNTYISANSTSCGNVGQSDFTVNLWVNTSATGTQALLAKRPSSGGGWYEVWLANGVVWAGLEDTNGSTQCRVSSGATTVNNGSWHMVTATRVGPVLTLYVDAVQVASATSAPTTLNLVNSAAVTLGLDTFSNHLNGNMADVLITYHAFSSTDVTNAYWAPIAYWNLNEGTGTIAFDDMMNANDMQMPGTTSWYPIGGELGGAFDFTGLYGSYVMNILNSPIGHPSVLGNFNSGDFSVNCWVKPVSSTGVQDVISKEYAASGGALLQLSINNGIVHATVSDGTHTADVSSGTYALNTTQWHMLTMTRSNGYVTLYVNDLNGQGQPQQQSWVSTQVLGVNIDSNGQMTMGQNLYPSQFQSASNFYNGYVDDARIFAYKLDAKQVTSLYNSQLAGTP